MAGAVAEAGPAEEAAGVNTLRAIRSAETKNLENNPMHSRI